MITASGVQPKLWRQGVPGINFAELIAPLGLEAFLEEYWEKKPLFVGAKGRPGKFSPIITVEDLSAFLSRADIRFPSLRLVKGGEELALSSYTKELRLGPHHSHDLIDNEKMYQFYNEGATIVLQFLQHNIPSFGNFTNDLEEQFGCNVQGSSFLTPPQAQGFTRHYDTYSFFVMQLAGSKRWSIYDRTPLLPIREDREDDDDRWTPIPPTDVVDLRAGDFLYVPRGWYHAPETSRESSVHITVGFFLPTWLDIIRSALAELTKTNEVRASPRLLRHSNRIVVDPTEQAMFERLVSGLDMQGGFRRLQDQYRSRRTDIRQNRLVNLLKMTEMNSGTHARLVSGVLIKNASAAKGGVTLQFIDKEIDIPAAASEFVKGLAQASSMPLNSIPSSLAIQSRVDLIKLLVQEGFAEEAISFAAKHHE